MKILVCIVTYNRADLLGRALKCIEQQTYKYSSLCIIDNASTDGTPTVAAEAVRNGARYVRMKSNVGGAGGFSFATRLFIASQNDGLLLLDDDAVAAPDLL